MSKRPFEEYRRIPLWVEVVSRLKDAGVDQVAVGPHGEIATTAGDASTLHQILVELDDEIRVGMNKP